MRNIALILMLTLVRPLVAAITSCGPAQIDLDVEVLFWRAAHCPYHFANLAGEEVTTVETDVGDTDLGARIEIGFQKRCFFARIGYLNWGSTDHRDVARPGRREEPADLILIGLPNPPNGADPGWMSARSRLRLLYEYFDLRLGNILINRDGCNFYTFANIRYLIGLERKERLIGQADLITTPDPVSACFEQNASFSGLGVGIGIGGEYHICGNLFVAGRLNSIIAFGTRKLIRHRSRFDPAFETEDQCEVFRDFNTIVPELNGRIRVGYRWPFCRVCLSAEIGYEFDYCWQAISLTDLNNLTRTCTDLGAAGPFLRLTMAF